jgi:hypothetical protein
VKAERTKDLELKSVEEWASLCLEKRNKGQELPSKPLKQQNLKKISKQSIQNLPPSLQPILIPDLCLPDIDWG